MTLRELAKKVRFKSMFNYLYKYFYKDESLTENEITELSIELNKIYKKLRELPKSDVGLYKIYVTQPVGTDTIIDVCLLKEVQDELVTFSELPIESIIDLEIFRALKMTDGECMAYIFRQIQKNIK